ncbi:MAG: histidine triad nucleotide-binding protein [Clostridiaceae bacterium]|jgi:histidine triad (HIT) family protein|nr:histidine triad nucleotide-binding protein [Bacillota bacterium]NLN52418.1 histidine triad nucleotide-binding protein [Clostridiaceae bacterium]
MQDCIFCKIAKHELEAEVVYENDLVIAFKDANPVTKVHILIMPKEHIKNFYELAKHPQQALIMGAVTEAAAEIADQFNISEGFRVITNNGRAGGQSVFHLHFHLIGGQELGMKLV